MHYYPGHIGVHNSAGQRTNGQGRSLQSALPTSTSDEGSRTPGKKRTDLFAYDIDLEPFTLEGLYEHKQLGLLATRLVSLDRHSPETKVLAGWTNDRRPVVAIRLSDKEYRAMGKRIEERKLKK